MFFVLLISGENEFKTSGEFESLLRSFCLRGPEADDEVRGLPALFPVREGHRQHRSTFPDRTKYGLETTLDDNTDDSEL